MVVEPPTMRTAVLADWSVLSPPFGPANAPFDKTSCIGPRTGLNQPIDLAVSGGSE